jgi:hypothetical protein
LFVAAFLGACATSSVSTLSSPPAPTQLDVAGMDDVRVPKLDRWCAEDAPPVEASAPPAIANGVNALAALASDPKSLRKHIRSEVQARIERAAFLHDESAALFTEQPLDPMHGVEAEVAALLAEGRACNAALVVGEMRIDFPPPFNETRDQNAQEIDAVHDIVYAGTSVTAYCGPCAIYALVVAPHVAGDASRGIDILAWDPLVGTDPMMGP